MADCSSTTIAPSGVAAGLCETMPPTLFSSLNVGEAGAAATSLRL